MILGTIQRFILYLLKFLNKYLIFIFDITAQFYRWLPFQLIIFSVPILNTQSRPLFVQKSMILILYIFKIMVLGNDDYDESGDDHQISDEENPSSVADYDVDISDDEGHQSNNEDIDDDSFNSQQDEDDQSYGNPDQPEILNEDEVQQQEPNEVNITIPLLTKYEKARVLGVRAVQISKNSPLYLGGDFQNMSPLQIAEKQLQQNKIPFIIKRYLPDGSFEHWKLSDLIISDR